MFYQNCYTPLCLSNLLEPPTNTNPVSSVQPQVIDEVVVSFEAIKRIAFEYLFIIKSNRFVNPVSVHCNACDGNRKRSGYITRKKV